MGLPTSIRLRDGRTAVVRLAEAADAEAQLANWNEIGRRRCMS